MTSTGNLRRPLLSSLGAALGLALLPKCPLCVAAYLASLGVGADLAGRAAPVVRPLVVAVLAVALLALVAGVRRRRSCCA
jgi:hypothetical protein